MYSLSTISGATCGISLQEPSDSAELKSLQEYTQKALERLVGLLREYTGQVSKNIVITTVSSVSLLWSN